MSDTEAAEADQDKVETEEDRNNGEPKGGDEGSDESDGGGLSDVEALVMQEAEQEIAVEERIRDAYRTAAEAEAEAGILKASSPPKRASVQEIVYCEGEEGKVTEIQGGNSID